MNERENDFHKSCSKKIFGTPNVPKLPYTRDNLTELAKQVIRSQTTLTGVQAKLSLDIEKGNKNEPKRFTIVGLWGRYILKLLIRLFLVFLLTKKRIIIFSL